MSEQSPIIQSPEISQQALARRLRAIAEADTVTSFVALEDFINGHNAHGVFDASIKLCGNEDLWYGVYNRSRNNGQGRFFSAMMSRPPILKGRSFLHAYALDQNEPVFGVHLPFDKDGKLDRSHPLTASTFMERDKVYAVTLDQPSPVEKDASIAISYAVKSAGAYMAELIEREWPISLEEALATDF